MMDEVDNPAQVSCWVWARRRATGFFDFRSGWL